MDTYSMRARLYPAILCLLPVLILAFYHVVALRQYYHLITALLSVGLFSFLLSQIGRDLGKKAEDPLFAALGGKPSTVMLRHSNGRLDSITKARYHQYLEQRIPGISLPTEQDELGDLRAADKVYESCIRYLISQTRDITKYSLLFKENTSYGFRRNLWAMKSWALAVISLCIFIHTLILLSVHPLLSQVNPYEWGVYLILLGCALFWFLVVSKEWVRIPAEAYAERLFETIEIL